MNRLSTYRWQLLAFCGLLLFSGCLSAPARKDAAINNLIEGGMSAKTAAIDGSEGLIEDYKVYRDGEEDGVVFETIFAGEGPADATTLKPAKIKKEVLDEIRSEQDTKELLGMGVYLRLVYKRSDGEVLCEARITKDDL